MIAIVSTGLSNGTVEGLNGKIRTTTRRAYGFHNAQSLSGFIMLCCTGIVLHPVFKSPPLHPLERQESPKYEAIRLVAIPRIHRLPG